MMIKDGKFEIAGRIDELLGHIPLEIRKETLLKGMMACPIMCGEKVVGVITDYDTEAGFWYGTIWADANPIVMNDYICSVELK